MHSHINPLVQKIFWCTFKKLKIDRNKIFYHVSPPSLCLDNVQAAVKPAAFLLSFAQLSCHLVEALINHLNTTLLLLTASKITILIVVSNTNPVVAAVFSLDSLVFESGYSPSVFHIVMLFSTSF